VYGKYTANFFTLRTFLLKIKNAGLGNIENFLVKIKNAGLGEEKVKKSYFFRDILLRFLARMARCSIFLVRRIFLFPIFVGLVTVSPAFAAINVSRSSIGIFFPFFIPKSL